MNLTYIYLSITLSLLALNNRMELRPLLFTNQHGAKHGY